MSQAFPEIDFEAYRFIDAPNETGSPERRLLLAVVERAILDYVGNDKREAEMASDWIFDEEDDGETELSFAWIVRELDLNLFRVRSKIRKMPKRGSNRVAPWYTGKTYPPKRQGEH